MATKYNETLNYLVVVQVKEGQVTHLVKGTCGDLGNPVPTKTELFQA